MGLDGWLGHVVEGCKERVTENRGTQVFPPLQ